MTKHRFGGWLIAAPLLVLTILLLALPLLASCSSGAGPSVPVAALGGSASASASPTASTSVYQKGLAFSACMRSHGVSGFPDPTTNGQGGVQLRLDKNSGIDPNSSRFKAAQQACQALMPGGKAGGGNSFDPSKIGPWAACIRSHGEPKFPDPQNTGDGVKIDLTGTGIDPSTLQTAIEACRSLSPGGMMQITAGAGAGQ